MRGKDFENLKNGHRKVYVRTFLHKCTIDSCSINNSHTKK